MFKIPYNRFCMFQFSCRLFINFSAFKPDTENNANFDAVSGKRANFDQLQFFKKHIHIPKLIIFGTHNLHTFKHNTLINELLLMQFYLVNIRPKLHPRNWRKLCVALFLTFSTPPAACICKLCYKLSSVVTFTFKQTFDQNFVFVINAFQRF